MALTELSQRSSSRPEVAQLDEARRFRKNLLLAMMVVVAAATALSLYLAQQNIERTFEAERQREFQGELAALASVQELRHAALVERCRLLVRRARIHAALEDDALDLLYPSARDELRDVMERPDAADGSARYGLHAQFYRFLDRRGNVIPPAGAAGVGALSPAEEARLALRSGIDERQLGYLVRRAPDGATAVAEILALPIVSTETGEAIAAIVFGFLPAEYAGARGGGEIRRGIWLDHELHLDGIPAAERQDLGRELSDAIAHGTGTSNSFGRVLEGVRQIVFYKQLNPASDYPPAFEVCVYPLAELRARQRHARVQVLGVGALLLLGGWAASRVVAGRLSRPVEKLELESAEDRAQRRRAEAALETTNEELQRAARFSADASHQLKTPVTVLRAGLEELLAREHFTPEECREISALIHQTYRLSSVIEDLLLLSRMDAGRLKIEFGEIDLIQLIDAAVDDLSAQPDALAVEVSVAGPRPLHVAGERRYLALILQNLLENARKYNRPGGRIRIDVRASEATAVLIVANTGPAIAAAAREHIFERFHRGTMGENVPGYGLGLNLARELARLHGGDVQLLRSDGTWTEFEVTFRLAPAA